VLALPPPSRCGPFGSLLATPPPTCSMPARTRGPLLQGLRGDVAVARPSVGVLTPFFFVCVYTLQVQICV
jgi:hypothetical protein